MEWHPNTKKHKALHNGYRKKPTKKEVIALMSFYNTENVMAKIRTIKKVDGVQLKIDF